VLIDAYASNTYAVTVLRNHHSGDTKAYSTGSSK
jgi:hypothetical protein